VLLWINAPPTFPASANPVSRRLAAKHPAEFIGHRSLNKRL
jgi:hypothetical protein